ncbi:hypothetical protein [Acetobacter aceti]|uniref:hypothetical protein n=1 Tax=Acetobacter aceti TaxID=435 RepID=UPI0011EA58FE|nr:hypothetical protein [Acetobacter aceti]
MSTNSTTPAWPVSATHNAEGAPITPVSTLRQGHSDTLPALKMTSDRPDPDFTGMSRNGARSFHFSN